MQSISFSRLSIGVCVLLALLYGARIAQADNAGHLLVADPAAAKLYVYSVPALELEAEFSEIRVAEHSGFLPISGGRVLFVNEKETEHDHDDEGDEGDDAGDHDEEEGDDHDEDGEDHAGHDHDEDSETQAFSIQRVSVRQAEISQSNQTAILRSAQEDDGHDHEGEEEAGGELIVLKLNLRGRPAIIGRTPVGAPASHIAVHPKMTYAVVGSRDPERAISVVDLRWWSSTSYDTILSAPLETVDPGVAIGGKDPIIYHRFVDPDFTLGKLEAFPLKNLLAENFAPTGTVSVDGPPHGEIISHQFKIFCSAFTMGIACADIQGQDLTLRGVIPYDTPERSGGQAFFARLANDGRRVYSYLRDFVSDTAPWEDWRNDAYIADIVSGEVTRLELGPGLVYRQALSDLYALYFTLHPDGDNAVLLDTNPKSPTFHQIIARIPLDPLQNPPPRGGDPFAAESRRVAISPDGRWGFISHGGDGLISVIDTQTQQVVNKLATPTPLTAGGYVIAVQSDMELGDTIGR